MASKQTKSIARCLFLLLLPLLSGCSVGYKFNGGSLDYTRLKTISIPSILNRASIVYPTLASDLTQQLQDFYIRRTRLDLVPRGGDLELECVITGYDLAPMAIGQDSYAARTVFTVTMQVKYINHDNEKESFDRSFKAYRDFGSEQPFVAVQDRLLDEIKEDLIKQIYNATIENW